MYSFISHLSLSSDGSLIISQDEGPNDFMTKRLSVAMDEVYRFNIMTNIRVMNVLKVVHPYVPGDSAILIEEETIPSNRIDINYPDIIIRLGSSPKDGLYRVCKKSLPLQIPFENSRWRYAIVGFEYEAVAREFARERGLKTRDYGIEIHNNLRLTSRRYLHMAALISDERNGELPKVDYIFDSEEIALDKKRELASKGERYRIIKAFYV